VPLSTPEELSVTPLGSAPVSLKVGAGNPVAVTVKVLAEFTVNDVLFALVMTGTCPIVRVKFWVALGETPFEAVIVIGKLPVTVAVPLSTPVELNVTPLGSAPISLKVGAGKPVAVKPKDSNVLTINVALFALVITAAWFTVSVKFCVAFGKISFEAVTVIGYIPPVPAPGVPLSTPAVFSVTPDGSAPLSVNVGAGKPLAVRLKEPVEPTVNIVLFALVMTGAWLTVSVKFCVAFGLTPFEAVKVIEYVPPVFAAGVPLSRPDPALKVTPLGKVPLSLRVGAGKPVPVTVNAPAVPTVKVILLALVMAGAWLTVRTKFCVAFGKMPFEAVIVMG
jgi:hypothetical protein